MSNSYQDLINSIDPSKLKESESAQSSALSPNTSASVASPRPLVHSEEETVADKSESTALYTKSGEDYRSIFKLVLLLDQKYKLGAIFRRGRYFSKQNSPTLRLALMIYADNYPVDRGTLSRVMRDLGVISDEGLLKIHRDSDEKERLDDFLRIIVPGLEVEVSAAPTVDPTLFAKNMLDKVVESFKNFPKSPPVNVAQRYEMAENEWLYFMRQIHDVRARMNGTLLDIVKLCKSDGNDRPLINFEIPDKYVVRKDADISRLSDHLAYVGKYFFEDGLAEIIEKKNAPGTDSETDTGLMIGQSISRELQSEIKIQSSLKSEKEFIEHGRSVLEKGEGKLLMLGGMFESYSNDFLGALTGANLLDGWEVERELLPAITTILERLESQLEAFASLLTINSRPVVLVASMSDLDLASEIADSKGARLTVSDVDKGKGKGKGGVYSTLIEIVGKENSHLMLEWLEVIPLIACGSSKDGDRILMIDRLLDVSADSDFMLITRSRVRNSDCKKIFEECVVKDGISDKEIVENSIVKDILVDNYYKLSIVTRDSDDIVIKV